MLNRIMLKTGNHPHEVMFFRCDLLQQGNVFANNTTDSQCCFPVAWQTASSMFPNKINKKMNQQMT
ncbi:MAG: hypothetical protein FWC50_06455 [Planctomycetaceae bacterium]|nr:hypothetical protein [Planctomycetaceae bacterium]